MSGATHRVAPGRPRVAGPLRTSKPQDPASPVAAPARRPGGRALRPARQAAPARRARHRDATPPLRPGGSSSPGWSCASPSRAASGSTRPSASTRPPRLHDMLENLLRRPPPAPAPPGAVGHREDLRRRRAGGTPALADRGHARDPRDVPARAGAVRPPHRPGRRRLRQRLAAAHLVRAGGADVRLRDPVRGAGAADPAAGDARPDGGELGALHPRHRRRCCGPTTSACC